MDARIEVWKDILLSIPCCLNCLDFDITAEVCKKYNSRPPAKIIHEGCEQWTHEIPF